jgi:hypothetical protein
MRKFILVICCFIAVGLCRAEQKPVPRIEQMPNFPPAYAWRDWKKTATDYDNFVFDAAKTGTHLPLVRIHTGAGVNYPSLHTIRMDTYVGQSNHGNVAEAINIIPAIVGVSLVGVDKTSHFNTDWVTKVKDFFNLKNGQNVYLNNYSAGTGGDWWYETMPNVFFYQLAALYPGIDNDFVNQLITIADRQLEVVFRLGGTLYPWQPPHMNYRAFNLLTGKPASGGVPEPEAAGAIAWILYQAYLETQEEKYRQGADLALSFLNGWTQNPSYEIQLPYGIAAAARMNAIEGTHFDLDKLLNWTFSAGAGTLRGWGAIVGNWNGYEMSGLIGEANDRGNDYAFSMNGFQHAAALAPVAKYDKRYARAIAKWILNLSNASRYFYRDELPAVHQESQSYAWSTAFDAAACIPYESIKENWKGVQPFAMGDATGGGWAATNLSLYSGSSIGYLAAIIDRTTVEGILQIDLNKTDFRGDNPYPACLFYNPHTTAKQVTLPLPPGSHDVYDAISETILQTNATGSITISIAADSVRLPVVYPAGSSLITEGRFRKVQDGGIIDYHYGYNYATHPLRIRAFTSDRTVVTNNHTVAFVCQTENSVAPSTYTWCVNAAPIAETATGSFQWIAPAEVGEYAVSCHVRDAKEAIQSAQILITVVETETESPSLPDITEKNDVTKAIVYPNPVRQNFTVVLPQEEMVQTVEIYNLLGQLLWSQKYGGSKSAVQINLALQGGQLYLVRAISTSSKEYVINVVK